MKRSLIYGIVAFATIAAVAVGLLVWAIPRRREADLLRVCWVGQTAHYVDSMPPGTAAACDDPVELRWPRERFPLLTFVRSHAGALEAADLGRVEAAVAEVNGQLGFPALRVADWDEPASVVVEVGVPAARGDSPEDCSHRRVGSAELASEARVRLRNYGHDAIAHRLLVHGLLHAIGLAHDYEATLSVMYPLTPGGLDPDVGRLRVTDHDRGLLRRLYGPTR